MSEYKNVGYQEARSDEEIILGLKHDARQRAREEYVDEKDTHSGRILVLIERLIRERDEARAKYEDLYVMAYGKDERDTWVAEAEARGYQRGVREAAAEVDMGLPIGAYTRENVAVLRTARAAILALLEQSK
jgi:hypothetical protein